MISPVRIPIPPQIGEAPPPIGSRTRTASAGTATKAIRGRVLLGGQQAQAVQRDLGQPRPEPAATGDQHAEHTVLAQGGLKIFRFAEHRRDAARHLSLPTAAISGPAPAAKLETRGHTPALGPSNPVCKYRGALTIQFRQKRDSSGAVEHGPGLPRRCMVGKEFSPTLPALISSRALRAFAAAGGPVRCRLRVNGGGPAPDRERQLHPSKPTIRRLIDGLFGARS
jgi:hypothetical protein